MALEITRASSSPVGIIADRRLCLTADKTRVVEDGDPAAAFLLATPGTIIPGADADRLGIKSIDGVIVLPGAESQPDPAPVPPTPPAPPAPEPEKKSSKRKES